MNDQTRLEERERERDPQAFWDEVQVIGDTVGEWEN